MSPCFRFLRQSVSMFTIGSALAVASGQDVRKVNNAAPNASAPQKATVNASDSMFEHRKHGFAKVVEPDSEYYFVHMKVKLREHSPSQLVLKQDNCILIGKDGRRFTKAYVSMLEHDSIGATEAVGFPIEFRSFDIQEDKPYPYKFQTKIITGPEGSLTYGSAYGGYAEFYFLWAVPKGFQAKSFLLGDVYKLDL